MIEETQQVTLEAQQTKAELFDEMVKDGHSREYLESVYMSLKIQAKSFLKMM